MPAPEPMLSSPGTRWPDGGDWVLQVKWDGFRLLVETPRRGGIRAWSRHGTSLSERLPAVLEALSELPAGTIVDGELVALAECNGRPAQDFAAVRRAVFTGDPEASSRLRFVAFDLLALAGEDLRSRTFSERDEQLRLCLPESGTVRHVESHPASRAVHDAIVALGFEGTVLKRRRSLYRAGRQPSWRKHKARHFAEGTLLEIREDREGHSWAFCDVGGRRIIASTAGVRPDVGRPVDVIYSRVDADGGLREARISHSFGRHGAGRAAA